MIKNISKLPKRKITVDELIHADDITDLLKEIYEKRSNVDQFLLIYTDHDGVPHNYWHGTNERLIWLLEKAKLQILSHEDEDDTDS